MNKDETREESVEQDSMICISEDNNKQAQFN